MIVGKLGTSLTAEKVALFGEVGCKKKRPSRSDPIEVPYLCTSAKYCCPSNSSHDSALTHLIGAWGKKALTASPKEARAETEKPMTYTAEI